jgi:hypothetical protein
MRRLEGDEIPPTEIEFYRHEDGRLQILIKGEHQNPIVQYNDYPLTRSYNGMACPILSGVSAGSGGVWHWNGAGGAAGGGSGSGGGASGGSSGNSGGAGGTVPSDFRAVAYGSTPVYSVPESVEKVRAIVNGPDLHIELDIKN